jgi:hypothetical protein
VWNLSAVLFVIGVAVVVVAPGSWAQSKYKTLHRSANGGWWICSPEQGTI